MEGLSELTETTMPYFGYTDLPMDSSYHSAFGVSSYTAFDEGRIEFAAAGELEKLVFPVEEIGDSESSDTTVPFLMNGGNEKKRPKVDDGCRVGFRMKSEVEILDDGFKWRKYGKKSVKNSPNPRNYYRCTSVGCGVKKRVERDREDPQYVITAYDGVHNHTSPTVYSYICAPQPQRTNPSSYWASRGEMLQ